MTLSEFRLLNYDDQNIGKTLKTFNTSCKKGLIQGLTEFLSVSLSGHLELAKAIFGDNSFRISLY